MRNRSKTWNGLGPAAAVLLLAAGLYLAFRSLAVANVVLSPVAGRPASTAAAGPSPAERARERDEALEAVGKPARDPFHPPARPAVGAPRVSVAPEPEAVPDVRMILFDRVNPEAQLSSGESMSGRLRVGQSFNGWTIVSIASNAVVVTKDGVTHTLTLRRQP